MSSQKTHAASLSLEEKVLLFKQRFAAREDAFYEKIAHDAMVTNEETGKKERVTKSRMFLACRNYLDEKLCLIKTSGGKCRDCTNRSNEVLTDTWIKKHILGNRILCLIPITADGTKMGAIDFDRSVQDGLEYVFSDAKKVKDFCLGLGIKSYIARSSNKGYHLYFFFEEWMEPNRVTSFLSWLLRETGFAGRMQTHSLPPPEIFPKQSLYNPEMVGNGIRVPLSEPDVRQGKNCFVDDDRNPYPLDAQWKLLQEAEPISRSTFDAVISENRIEIHTDGFGKAKKRKTIKTKQKITKEDGTVEEVEVEQEEPVKHDQFGSFWSVVAACPAMQEYWTKAPNSQKYLWDVSNPKGLFHHARYASMALALATLDGEAILKDRWTSATTASVIEDAKTKGYSPVTCRWMQSCGVCKIGKHPKYGSYCYKKTPPYHKENGKLIENPDKLSEEEWPEVSPIRYRTENRLTVDDIKERFAMISRGLKAQKSVDAGEVVVELNEAKQPIVDKALYTPEKAGEMVASLMRRLATMKESDREDVSSYVLANKWFTKTEWNSKLKAAGAIVSQERKLNATQQYKSFVTKGRSYFLKDGQIMSIYTDAKGVTHEEMFTNFWLERLAEPARIKLRQRADYEEVLYEDRTYKLIMHVNNQQRPITVPNKIFSNAAAFFEQIRTAGGTEIVMSTSKDAYDVMMCAITSFSDPLEEKYSFDEIGYYDLKAGLKYVMPSVIVTKDSIERNDTYVLEMDDDYTKCLDFKIVDNREFGRLALHIVNDFFKANNETATMAVFAHAMASVCIRAVEESVHYKKAPVLWWWGGYGGGKTWMLEQAQYFFGDFSNAATVSSTGSFKSKIGVAHHFRHAFSFYDDSKDSLSSDGGRGMKQFVQNAYDRNIMSALTRDGSLRKNPTRVRGLVAVSAEDPIEKESSAISRLIMIDASPAMRKDKGEKIQENRHLYCGFTPYVVKHVLNIERETIVQMWKTFNKQISEGSEGADDKSGANRICENLTMNYFGMQVALDTMVANGAIDREMAMTLSAKHLENLRAVKDNMIDAVRSARGSQVFIRELKQLLADPIKYKILGWPGTEIDAANRAQTLGFITDRWPGVVYVYPELAYQAVSQAMRVKNTVPQTQAQISRQLAEDGCFVDALLTRKEQRYTCKRVDPNKIQQNVYPLRAEVLGLNEIVQGDVAPIDTNKRKPVSSHEDEFPLQ